MFIDLKHTLRNRYVLGSLIRLGVFSLKLYPPFDQMGVETLCGRMQVIYAKSEFFCRKNNGQFQSLAGKTLALFLNAFKQVKDRQLQCVGNGPYFH